MRTPAPWSVFAALVLVACPADDGPKDATETDAEIPDETDETDPPAAGITELSPATATVGAEVEARGTHLGTDAGTVTVDGVAATVVSWSDTAVRFVVPDVFPGARDVVVAVGREPFAPRALEVVLPRRAYVLHGMLDGTHDLLSTFDVSPTGTLTPWSDEPLSLGAINDGEFGGDPSPLALDVAHRRLFAGLVDHVAVLSLDGETGAPDHVAGSPFATGGGYAFGVTVSADGGHLYATRCGDNDLAHFLVGDDGDLTPAPVPTYGVDECLDDPILTPDGRWLYATAGDRVYGFEVAADGALTALPWSPASHDRAPSYGKSLTPDGARLYFAHFDVGLISGHDIGLEGELTPLEGSPWAVGETDDWPITIAFHPNGRVAYIPSWGAAGLTVSDVTTSGALTPREPALSTVDEPASTAVAADGSLLLVLGQAGRALEVFTLDADGTPTSAGAPTSFEEPAYPTGLAITF